jgi:hypothetical protein
VTPKKPKHVRFWGNRREGGGARRKRELTPFANDHTDLAALGAEVVAISSHGLESHAELARRLGIPFPLLGHDMVTSDIADLAATAILTSRSTAKRCWRASKTCRSVLAPLPPGSGTDCGGLGVASFVKHCAERREAFPLGSGFPGAAGVPL